MSFDKAWLAQTIAGYMHREDLEAQINSIFIPFATQRIGRDLRSQANNLVIDFDMTTNPETLPINFVAIRALTVNDSNGKRLIKSGTLSEMSQFSQGSGRSVFYQINADMLSVAPTQLATYQLDYFAYPDALLTDESTNAVLSAYPYLYLYAALVEGFFYTQEPGGHDKAMAQYLNEIEKINKQSASARGGSMPAGG